MCHSSNDKNAQSETVERFSFQHFFRFAYLHEMKTLLVIRHAKSDWNNPLQRDFERTLNKRGLSDAPMMGNRLLHKGIKVDLLLSSTAKRAAQTAEAIAECIQYPIPQIKWEANLYHASPETITNEIIATADRVNCLLVVCHNPGITHFINSICGSITANMPTCGIAAFSIACDHWIDFPIAKAALSFYDFPKNTV